MSSDLPVAEARREGARIVRAAARPFGAILFALPLVALGLTRALLTHDVSFGVGDNHFFFAIARFLLRGEVMYEDIVHFRTPGLHYYSALFLRAFGPRLASQMLALTVESYVLYPVILYACGLALLRSRLLAGAAGLVAVLLPGVLQLRAALGLVAVTLYALEERRRDRRLLAAAGAALGLTFVFGQEVALMALFAIAAWEVRSHARSPGRLLRRAALFGVGASVVLVPFVLSIAVFSDLATFAYYTFVYALTVAPRGIDLPFPSLIPANAAFYLPFALYLVAFVNLFLGSRLDRAAAVLLGFGTLRLISALGRSDVPHLIFSIPEVFLAVSYSLRRVVVTPGRLIPLLPWLLALGSALALSIAFSPLFLLAAPLLYAGASLHRDPPDGPPRPGTGAPLALLAPTAALSAGLIAALAPLSWQELWVAPRLLPDQPRHGGVRIDATRLSEIRAVEHAIRVHRPATIFSYPLRPFFYTLVEGHASRFLAHEWQTTPEEQAATIADLRATRPGLVLLDVPQAVDLSRSLSLISDHITSNYAATHRITAAGDLRVMVPKPAPSLEEHLALRLYEENRDRQGVHMVRVVLPDGLGVDAIRQSVPESRHRLAVREPAVLLVGVVPPPEGTVCGAVEIAAGGRTLEEQVCSDRGRHRIDLNPFQGARGTIILRVAPGKVLDWWDPVVVARPGAP